MQITLELPSLLDPGLSLPVPNFSILETEIFIVDSSISVVYCTDSGGWEASTPGASKKGCPVGKKFKINSKTN